MNLRHKYDSLLGACHASPILYGIPAGFCIVGMSNLLLPGASMLTTSLGWTLIYIVVTLPCVLRAWCSRAAAWTLWGASVVMTVGVVINCHYFVHVWGCGDVSRPLLMNLDHWSAWNNALYHLGSDHAVESLWPAEGYGRFIGLLMKASAIDISIPLLFNCFCVLCTIALTGALTSRFIRDAARQRKAALCAIVLMSLMGDLIASGTILLKDAPMAMATALVAWSAIRLRYGGNLLRPLAAIAAAVFITCYARPNYLSVFIVLIPGVCAHDKRNITIAAAISVCCAVILLYFHSLEAATPAQAHFAPELGTDLDDSAHQPQHAAYYDNFSFYFKAPVWKRLLLLPITLGVQFLIPLPWNFANNLAFGPFIALAYFGFCRYFTGLLVAFFLFKKLRKRSFTPALRLCLVGLAFYAGVAFIFGGTVSRYGIPLLCLFVPCASLLWTCRNDYPRLRTWLVAGGSGIAAVLFVFYFLSV
ncbi:MAG: hypothetical protein K2L21_07260 [Muribaculaceae bacterium]|nr:hypothetical protein [Muribaculaceae bacterium]